MQTIPARPGARKGEPGMAFILASEALSQSDQSILRLRLVSGLGLQGSSRVPLASEGGW
jgi:hypothetical protein